MRRARRSCRCGFVLDTPKSRSADEAHSIFGPLLKLCGDVRSAEDDLSRPADEFVFESIGLGRDESEDGSSIGRGYGDPTFARLQEGVDDQIKAKLLDVEPQTAIDVTHENANGMNAEEGISRSGLGRGHFRIIRPKPVAEDFSEVKERKPF